MGTEKNKYMDNTRIRRSYSKVVEDLKDSKYRILTRYRKVQLVVMDYKYFKEKVEPLLIEK